MLTPRFALLAVLSAAIISAGPSLAQAATVTTYTSESSFQAAIGSHAFDNFDDLHPGDNFNSPYTRTDPTFGSVVYTANDNIFSNGGNISTEGSEDSLTLAFSSNSIFAVGGFAFPADVNGDAVPAALSIHLMSGTTVLANPTFTGTGAFYGFTSDLPITSLTIDISSNNFVTLDNLYFGSVASAVPLPSSLFAAPPLLAVMLLTQWRKTKNPGNA